MLTWSIAFRNIFRHRRRTLLTVLTMVGGFALNSISIGWADGTYNRVIDMFTRNQLGHIQIHAEGYLDRPSIYKTVDDYQQIGQIVDSVEGVESWSPRLYAAGLVSVEDKSSAAQVIGIDPQREVAATSFDKKITDGSLFTATDNKEALVGKGLAAVLKADVSDSVVIFSQAADGSIANDIYQIVGIVESGNQMQDRTSLYLRLSQAQSLFVLNDRVHELAVIADELDEVRELSEGISHAIDDQALAVAPWQEFAKSFYHAMTVDRQGTWIMLGVIALIVAIGVLNTVLMTVLERRREYGVLKAVGTRPGGVVKLVLYEVAIMAVISLVVGSILGLVGNYLLAVYGFQLDTPYTYGGVEFANMQGEVNFRSFWIPGLTVFLAAVIVSLFPAIKAARVEPARAMRMH